MTQPVAGPTLPHIKASIYNLLLDAPRPMSTNAIAVALGYNNTYINRKTAEMWEEGLIAHNDATGTRRDPRLWSVARADR